MNDMKLNRQPPTLIKETNPTKKSMYKDQDEKTKYTIGTVWINKRSRRIYMLANINAKNADWVLIGSKK